MKTSASGVLIEEEEELPYNRKRKNHRNASNQLVSLLGMSEDEHQSNQVLHSKIPKLVKEEEKVSWSTKKKRPTRKTKILLSDDEEDTSGANDQEKLKKANSAASSSLPGQVSQP